LDYNEKFSFTSCEQFLLLSYVLLDLNRPGIRAGFGFELALFVQLDLNPFSFLCSFGCVHESNQSSLAVV
jgi:hypothetical protein